MYVSCCDSAKKEKKILILIDARISLSTPHLHPPISLCFQIRKSSNYWACNPVSPHQSKDKLSAVKWPWMNLSEISQEKGLNMFLWVQCWEEWRENKVAPFPGNQWLPGVRSVGSKTPDTYLTPRCGSQRQRWGLTTISWEVAPG